MYYIFIIKIIIWVVRNKYNFLNSFWMKTNTDSVRYCRIRIWNRIEKINENRIRMYPLYYHTKFEYGYRYLYWCLNGYGYRIIRISAILFPSLAATCVPGPSIQDSVCRLALFLQLQNDMVARVVGWAAQPSPDTSQI